MKLAAILTIYFLSFGSPSFASPTTAVTALAAQAATTDSNTAAPQSSDSAMAQPQTSPAQKPDLPQDQTSGASKNSSGTQKPIKPRHRSKKATDPNCLNSSNSAASRGAQAGKGTTGSSTTSQPCPPPKKVVHNGGSDEPSIQLVGGDAADQASKERSTEQLTAATEENLKKIAGRQLSSTQEATVGQIKQFMDQSKKAVADGDPERGHNLAMKARLLSDELVKP